MKCLEKNRSRRYDTANGLAADLKRHLNNEPVIARPPSAAYKLQKAWRRNKLVFSAGATVAAGIEAFECLRHLYFFLLVMLDHDQRIGRNPAFGTQAF